MQNTYHKHHCRNKIANTIPKENQVSIDTSSKKWSLFDKTCAERENPRSETDYKKYLYFSAICKDGYKLVSIFLYSYIIQYCLNHKKLYTVHTVNSYVLRDFVSLEQF